jgi:hypothetical protein
MSAQQQFDTRRDSPAPAELTGAAPQPSANAAPDDNAVMPIGIVLEIAGSSSQIALDLQRLNECADDSDPSIALAGQVGSQVKIRVGDAGCWPMCARRRRTGATRMESSPASTSWAKAMRND